MGCHMEEQVLPSGCHMGCHMEEQVLPSGCHMGCHMDCALWEEKVKPRFLQTASSFKRKDKKDREVVKSNLFYETGLSL